MENHFIKINKWLYPASWLYGAVVKTRNKLFDWGVLRSKSFDIPIICIGNLAVGGTGKTPHTEYLIKLLQKEYNVAVLSRGYKRQTKGYVLATPDSNARSIGDEPYQIYQKFPDITLGVDEDRCHGIEKLLRRKKPPTQVILLDDAYQHRYVKAGLTILLTDYNRLFCDDALLPAGRLREQKSGKYRAQIILVTKCPSDIKPIDYNIIAKRLDLYPYQKLYFSAFKYGNLQPVFPHQSADLEKPKEQALASLTGKSIVLVTGIVSPQPLMEELKKRTSQVELLAFDDHHAFTKQDFMQIQMCFNQQPPGNRLIVTTEKDAARLIHHPDFQEELKPFVYALPITIKILQNQQDNFNQNIFDYVRENSRNSRLS